jgi:hypothetical protein
MFALSAWDEAADNFADDAIAHGAPARPYGQGESFHRSVLTSLCHTHRVASSVNVASWTPAALSTSMRVES